MAFDPDKYLATKSKRQTSVKSKPESKTAEAGAFDPDAYLASKITSGFEIPEEAKISSDQEKNPYIAALGRSAPFLNPTGVTQDILELAKNSSTLNSLLRGGANMAPLSLSDELTGARTALAQTNPIESNYLPKLGSNYVAARDTERQKDIEAQNANPKTYLLGELLGGSLSAPALGQLQFLQKGAKFKGLANLGALKSAGKLARLGAVQGYGMSEAEPLSAGAGLDVLKGSLIGGVAGSALGAGAEAAMPYIAPVAAKGAAKIQGALESLPEGIKRLNPSRGANFVNLDPNNPNLEYGQLDINKLKDLGISHVSELLGGTSKTQADAFDRAVASGYARKVAPLSEKAGITDISLMEGMLGKTNQKLPSEVLIEKLAQIDNSVIDPVVKAKMRTDLIKEYATLNSKRSFNPTSTSKAAPTRNVAEEKWIQAAKDKAQSANEKFGKEYDKTRQLIEGFEDRSTPTPTNIVKLFPDRLPAGKPLNISNLDDQIEQVLMDFNISRDTNTGKLDFSKSTLATDNPAQKAITEASEYWFDNPNRVLGDRQKVTTAGPFGGTTNVQTLTPLPSSTGGGLDTIRQALDNINIPDSAKAKAVIGKMRTLINDELKTQFRGLTPQQAKTEIFQGLLERSSQNQTAGINDPVLSKMIQDYPVVSPSSAEKLGFQSTPGYEDLLSNTSKNKDILGSFVDELGIGKSYTDATPKDSTIINNILKAAQSREGSIKNEALANLSKYSDPRVGEGLSSWATGLGYRKILPADLSHGAGSGLVGYGIHALTASNPLTALGASVFSPRAVGLAGHTLGGLKGLAKTSTDSLINTIKSNPQALGKFGAVFSGILARYPDPIEARKHIAVADFSMQNQSGPSGAEYRETLKNINDQANQ